jgi:hypothetical protein
LACSGGSRHCRKGRLLSGRPDIGQPIGSRPAVSSLTCDLSHIGGPRPSVTP